MNRKISIDSSQLKPNQVAKFKNNIVHNNPISNSQQQQQQQTSSPSINVLLLQKVISANQELMKSQSILVKSLSNQLFQKQKAIEKLTQTNKQLQMLIEISKIPRQFFQSLSLMSIQVQQLQAQLVETKIQLAIKSSELLVCKILFILQEKDTVIRDLNNKNKLLDEELERMSTFSENDIQQRKNGQIKQKIKIQVNKQNLADFVMNSISNSEVITSLRSLFDKQSSSGKSLSQNDQLTKYWQKQVQLFILPRVRFFSTSFNSKKQLNLQRFIKSTVPLLKKYYGIPHIYRNKVWPFISEDRLGISNSLYIQLLDRRSRGWVSEKIKKQIEKDINRSFNGQSSKEKLLKIYKQSQVQTTQTQKSLTRVKSSIQPTIQHLIDPQTSMKQTPEKTQINTLKALQSTQQPANQQSSLNFIISQDVTQVLEIFYIYRPDIGFVQGMTYPAIFLTLVTGKISAFRILCNILLTNDFFRKMITFQPNFINCFCRIFDQLLLIQNLNLYNLVLKQYDIKSEVFLVDWFFTFFSRGISPKTILRLWDILLYQNSINSNPEIILYKTSLIIFELLSPILLQTTYEECIQSIREYPKKLDEQQLIKCLYQSLKDSSVVKAFEEKYAKIKLRVEKKYYNIENDE